MRRRKLSKYFFNVPFWFLIKFSCTSVSFIFIVKLLIEGERRNHTSIDFIKAKVIFFLTHDAMVVFGRSILIAKITRLRSKISIACSTSKISLLYRHFFSRSLNAKRWSRLLDWYREALGSNTLTLKNAFWPVIHKFLY